MSQLQGELDHLMMRRVDLVLDRWQANHGADESMG
jgi:hypothetical protein